MLGCIGMSITRIVVVKAVIKFFFIYIVTVIVTCIVVSSKNVTCIFFVVSVNTFTFRFREI